MSAASAQTFTVLSTSNQSGEAYLTVQGTDGNLYGITSGQAATVGCGGTGVDPCGSIFEMNLAGEETVLYTFSGYTNGGTPYLLTQGTDGNFYGATEVGGSDGCQWNIGCGTLFQMTPEGSFTVLDRFSFPSSVLAFDIVSLIPGPDGSSYGITEYGGNTTPAECQLFDEPVGCGTFFQMTSTGAMTTLYSFCSQANCADGLNPYGLVQGSDGNFYGFAAGGANGGGTFFEITPAGVLTTIYNFPAPSVPEAANLRSGLRNSKTSTSVIRRFAKLTAGSLTPKANATGGGNNSKSESEPNSVLTFYGVVGALNGGYVFEITSSGEYSVVYNFCSQPSCADGADPNAVLLASDGNLYGTTSQGGTGAYCTVQGGCGTIFELELTPSVQLTTLYNFCSQPNCADGVAEGSEITGIESGGLLQASDTIFYGSSGAPSSGLEVFFSLSNNLTGSTASTTTLGLQPASVTVGSSGPVVMTATVAPASGSGPTPTGTVAFSNGSTYLGTAALVAGVGAYNYDPSGLAVDTYQITAAYSGDATYAPPTTPPAQTLTVTPETPAATPTFSLSSGTYSSAQALTISDATAGAIVYYTTDGSTPTTSSAVYFGPLVVNSTETVKAIAVAGGYTNSNVASATYTINLTADFQFSASSTSLTIAAGQSANSTLTVTPENGFDSQVSFSCSALPSGVTCSFNPASVTPSGNTAATTTLTVSTTAASAALRPPERFTPLWAYGLLLPCVGMIFCGLGRSRRLQRRLWIPGMMGVLVLAAALSSCSSTNQSGTSSTQATITVNATTGGSAAITHSVNLTVTITQ